MKFTNNFNIPDPFVAAVTSDDYERGDAEFTATELIRPSRILALTRKFHDELIEDVSDRVWAFQGQTKHIVLERAAKANPDRYVVEKRLEATMPETGAKISAQFDLFDRKDRTLYDWKETSVFKFILGDLDEWTAQANINLYLMRRAKVTVNRLVNIAILKDFKIREARFGRNPDYPKCAINVVELPMWTVEKAEAFINEKVRQHRAQMDNPPVCNKQERWQRDATYAVMRTDRKRAVRLYGDKDQAEAALIQYMKTCPPGDSKKFYLEERDAEPVRCLDFCPVQTFCDFGISARKKWDDKSKKEDE